MMRTGFLATELTTESRTYNPRQPVQMPTLGTARVPCASSNIAAALKLRKINSAAGQKSSASEDAGEIHGRNAGSSPYSQFIDLSAGIRRGHIHGIARNIGHVSRSNCHIFRNFSHTGCVVIHWR
jgi:hypothetical protein